MVRRTALARDLGRVAVSNAIWEKPGPFGLTDWERIQLHPYFTERSFAHAPALASIGELADAHHERLDGAGYHRKAPAPALGRAARILAAADSYQAMRERRPHRPALDADGAETELLRDAREGRLCPEAVDAVLAAAGHRVAKRPRELPAGLTDRELEVLLALAAGKTNKEIAETLGSPPRRQATTSSTSSTRRACEPGPPRRSGRSSATSYSPTREPSCPF
jgi:HD-GYP domain-containing protein (c-di-GMP phosphodiesterase class II)